MLNQSSDRRQSKVEGAPQCWMALLREERCKQNREKKKTGSAQTLRGAFQLYSRWPLQTLKHIFKNTNERQLIERFGNECLPHCMLQQTHLFSQGCVFHKSCPHPYTNKRSDHLMYSSLPLAVPAATDSRRDFQIHGSGLIS